MSLEDNQPPFEPPPGDEPPDQSAPPDQPTPQPPTQPPSGGRGGGRPPIDDSALPPNWRPLARQPSVQDGPLPPNWKPLSRPPGDRANMFPPNVRVPPPAPFQRYAMPIPTRGTGAWGQPDQFGALPQQFELGGLYNGLGRYFQQYGAGMSPQFGLLAMIFNNAHQKAAMQGQLEQARLAKEQLDLNATMLEQNEQRRLIEYSDVISEFEAASGQDDPDKIAGNFTVGGMTFHQAMEAKAQELDDKDLQGLLNSGAPASKIIQYLQGHEAKWRALHAANKKSGQTAADDALWDQSPGSGETSGGGETGGAGGGAATSADQIQEGLPPKRAPATATGEKSGLPEPDPAKRTPMDEAVISGMQGTVDTTGMGTEAKAELGRRINAGNAAVDKIVNNPKLSADQVDQQVRAISPEIADDAKLVAHYSMPVAGGQSASSGASGKERAYNERLAKIAKRINPSWDAGIYTIVQDFRKDAIKPQSPIQRITTASTNAREVLNVLDQIAAKKAEGKGMPTQEELADTSTASLAALAGRDPLFAQLKIAWMRLQEDTDVLARGSPSVGLTEQAIRVVPLTADVKGYRGAVLADMTQVKNRAAQVHNTWDQFGTGEDMPSVNKQAEADIDKMSQLDIDSGKVPGDKVTAADGSSITYKGKDANGRPIWERD